MYGTYMLNPKIGKNDSPSWLNDFRPVSSSANLTFPMASEAKINNNKPHFKTGISSKTERKKTLA